jgi:5-methylcytosine-specific restriction endonuclease McrA
VFQRPTRLLRGYAALGGPRHTKKCATAGHYRRLTLETATLDHVVAAAKGGRTELTNLQPLCGKCNVTKGDSDVDVVDVVFTFPLRPPPSDGYEGAIW